MKVTIALLVGALALLVVVSVVILWLAAPQPWPVPPGTLTVKKVAFDGQSYVKIEGEPMNALGQVQSINVEVDDDAQRIVVSRCIVRWSPFSRVTVNNQWPVFYPLDSLKPGRYSVVYLTKDGEGTAGYVDVP
ncbi:hypothetical protein G4L39_07390 [Limisphaera ngatamarikiensis]|uniref:Uncharacterized protein n=1 Tax=Limisphaera ngatamarikiensis TaxID=1324935 RepID=A0A6M1RUX1_9BACT|nr:hypothetical protein [Limisphaera ngatamarikiensis]NGO39221.1 hypothetical protein [Limisphaera ngatamarikiensis]